MANFSYSFLSSTTVSTGDGNDTVTISNTSTNPDDGLYYSTLNTGNGNDSVVISSYYTALKDSTINLGDGNDSLNAQSNDPSTPGYDYSSSTVDAGSGDDTVYAYTPSNTTFIGGIGKNTILFSGLTNNWSINTRAKDDFGRAYIAVGSNRVYGFETIQFQQPDPSGLLTKTLKGTKDGVDPLLPWKDKPIKQGSSINEKVLNLTADAGGNQLWGSSLADSLTGSDGNDILIGNRGSDVMSGMGGSDLFVLATSDWFETDRITDFQPKVDKLMLTGLSSDSTLYRALASSNKTIQQSALATVKDDNVALISKAILVYSKQTGNLYYNPNQQALGLGSGGGLMAILMPNLQLSGADVLVAPVLPF